MKAQLGKYLPWVLVLILATLTTYFGIGTPDAAPAVPIKVTVRDTVRDTLTQVVRVPVQVVRLVRDTTERTPEAALAEIDRLDAERDSLNREILRYGATRADFDSTLTLAIGDSSRVTVRAQVSHEIEEGNFILSLTVVEAVLAVVAECPGETPWGWITAAGAGLAAVLSAILK